MAPVLVEIGPAPATEDSDVISVVPDVDSLSSTEVMLGCGESNPY
jgi:hypothetical protein